MSKRYPRFLSSSLLALGLVLGGAVACESHKNPCAGVDAGGGDIPAECLCGNGSLDKGEQCDDGNDNDKNDSCSNDCKSNLYEELCGDGVVGSIKIEEEGKAPIVKQEECDDGNKINGDGCNAWCFKEDYPSSNGQAATQEELEISVPSEQEPSPATEAPTRPFCGDGHIDRELGEECDDGNLESGDRCSSDCRWELSEERATKSDDPTHL